MHYTNSTDVIATWKAHHGGECKTYDLASSLSSPKAESANYQVKVEVVLQN